MAKELKLTDNDLDIIDRRKTSSFLRWTYRANASCAVLTGAAIGAIVLTGGTATLFAIASCAANTLFFAGNKLEEMSIKPSKEETERVNKKLEKIEEQKKKNLTKLTKSDQKILKKAETANDAKKAAGITLFAAVAAPFAGVALPMAGVLAGLSVASMLINKTTKPPKKDIERVYTKLNKVLDEKEEIAEIQQLRADNQRRPSLLSTIKNNFRLSNNFNRAAEYQALITQTPKQEAKTKNKTSINKKEGSFFLGNRPEFNLN